MASNVSRPKRSMMTLQRFFILRSLMLYKVLMLVTQSTCSGVSTYFLPWRFFFIIKKPICFQRLIMRHCVDILTPVRLKTSVAVNQGALSLERLPKRRKMTRAWVARECCFLSRCMVPLERWKDYNERSISLFGFLITGLWWICWPKNVMRSLMARGLRLVSG